MFNLHQLTVFVAVLSNKLLRPGQKNKRIRPSKNTRLQQLGSAVFVVFFSCLFGPFLGNKQRALKKGVVNKRFFVVGFDLVIVIGILIIVIGIGNVFFFFYISLEKKWPAFFVPLLPVSTRYWAAGCEQPRLQGWSPKRCVCLLVVLTALGGDT